MCNRLVRLALFMILLSSLIALAGSSNFKTIIRRTSDGPDKPPRDSHAIGASPRDVVPVSFEDIASGRFQPMETKSVHLPQLIEGDQYPNTLLFADPPKAAWAPIIDVTEPISYRALNALVQRYRHLHVYRNYRNGGFDSRIIVVRKAPLHGVVVARGSRIEGLNERIVEIEHVRRRYGMEVAWARFHRLFTPVEDVAPAEDSRDKTYRRGSPTWADIVASEFIPVAGTAPEAIREHLDLHRIGKFKSLDGKHWLGIRVSPQGIADHYEAALHEAHL